ncbi:AAA family ATPase [Caballeronia sp. GAFFF1]|uniref:AAA family ATPase n=1 Tax=Caballeronia sp. GAFFF1 TaxID=2921779 RepID=UPI002028BC6C|nr:AAA family ATPase [Caballeronia sp. GAFFF1]
MQDRINFLNLRELIGIAKRRSPDRDEARKLKQWAGLLLEHANKRFGAQLTPGVQAGLRTLAERHPNFSEAVDFVSAEMAFARAAGHGLSFARLLLVGPAGTGKTTFCLELAKLLGVPSQVASVNNVQTSAFLTGTERHWSNSEPGAVFQLLANSAYINPILVLDEIDKAHGHHQGYDPLNGLYTLLERRTAERFFDAALPGVHFDASRINWIATANSLEPIRAPLLSRFNVFQIRPLSEDELREVVARMFGELLENNPAVARQIDGALPDDVLDALCEKLGTGRDIDRMLRVLVGRTLQAGESAVSIRSIPAHAAKMQGEYGSEHRRPIGFY